MNLRAGPGAEHEIIGRLLPGSWVTVGREVDGWVETAAGYLWADNPAWVELSGETQPQPARQLSGVDVSHWQGEIDWRLMQERGVEVAYIKVTEGIHTVDPSWQNNHNWARAYGIKVGPYHYYKNNRPPAEQARHFRNQYGMVEWDMPPAGDFEDNTPSSPAAGFLSNDIHAFLQQSGCGVVYTAAWWWNPNVGAVSWAGDYRLWVASYDVPEPHLPFGWSDWWGWQYAVTDNGHAYGVTSLSGRLDLDRFKEDIAGPLSHWPVNSRALSVGGNAWSDGHQAADLAARQADPVYAAHSGIVQEVGHAADGYGHYITVAGLDTGIETLYAHLSRVDVAEGDIVDGGQRIGLAGSTGKSTGPHVHMELRIDGERVNPYSELQRLK
jgi:GH25 family lysozyme M1 (1,4-beta-N-acetylmuramidase)